MRDCSLTTESRTEECGIVTQVAKRAPRVCGDDPSALTLRQPVILVLPAYAGMIHIYYPKGHREAHVLPAYAGMIHIEWLVFNIIW